MEGRTVAPGLTWAAILLTALALSVGWGVRGNWGHEFGAMIAGALAGMTACMLSGREDWRRRVAFFAFFGAMGWSFGGSISYGQVLGYTHSDEFASILYGNACIFIIGFLWGAMGGAGTALPAFLDRKRLTEFFPPLCCIFAVWAVQWVLFTYRFLDSSDFYWYDTDWVAARSALVVILLYALARRRLDGASKLILAMTIGWWIGFLLLVVVLGLRMTPPRSDNWAGCLGMTAAMLIVLWRSGLRPVAFAALAGGFFSGFGFMFGNWIKLVGISTGVSTNWHSVMEQSYGFISGIGIALIMGWFSTRGPALNDEPRVRRWTEPFCFLFILVLLTFLNIRKNPQTIWVPNQVLPEAMYGLSADAWFNLAYALMAAAVMVAVWLHTRAPLSIVPATWLGKGQAFFLLFLWWIVIGNLSRYLPFHPQRMVTEGVIHLNACLCTMLVLGATREAMAVPKHGEPDWSRWVKQAGWIGGIVCLVGILVLTLATMPLFDAPIHGAHFRFGQP